MVYLVCTQGHNIYNYLDQIWHETKIFIDRSRMLDHEFYMQNLHFLQNKHDKPNFHKNINIFFLKYPYSHVGNKLLVNDMPCKIMFNRSYRAIFLNFFYDLRGHNHYLSGIVFPYLEIIHSSTYGVSTFV